MAEEFLQGVQIGSNLFDRAQTQRRLQEQAQVQLGHLAIQQQQADMQQKMQQLALSDAIEEKRFQAEDTPQYYQFQRDVQNYLSNPSAEAPLPSVPQFRSKAFRAEGDATLKQLSQFSNRAVAMKQMDTTRQLMNQLENDRRDEFQKEVSAGMKHSGTRVLDLLDTFPGRGVGADGRVDVKALDALRRFNAPFQQQEADLKLARDKQVAEGGVQATRVSNQVRNAAKQGLVDMANPDEVAEAENYFYSSPKLSADESKGITVGDSAVKGLTRALGSVNEFEKTYKTKFTDNYAGPLDAQITNLKKKVSSNPTPRDQDALKILQAIDKVRADIRRGYFGATLTTGEIASMNELMPQANSGSYLQFAEGMRDLLKAGLGDYIRRNKLSSGIAKSLKEEYAPDLFRKFETQGPPQPSVVSETTVETPSGVETSTVAQEPALPPGWKFTR